MSLSLKLSINEYKLRNFFTRKVQITISGIMNHTRSENNNKKKIYPNLQMLKTKQKRCKSKRRRIRESSCLSRKDSSFFSKASVETRNPDPVSGKVRGFITNQRSETKKYKNDHKPVEKTTEQRSTRAKSKKR